MHQIEKYFFQNGNWVFFWIIWFWTFAPSVEFKKNTNYYVFKINVK